MPHAGKARCILGAGLQDFGYGTPVLAFTPGIPGFQAGIVFVLVRIIGIVVISV